MGNLVGDLLPTTVATENKPAFQFEVKHQMTVQMIMEGVLPLVQKANFGSEDYMHLCLHAAAPLDKVMSECLNAWDAYQEEWKAQGYDHPYVPYPYSMDTMKAWFDEYEEKVGPLSIEDKEQWMERKRAEGGTFFGSQMAGDGTDDAGNAGDMAWWKENCRDTHFKMPSHARVS